MNLKDLQRIKEELLSPSYSLNKRRIYKMSKTPKSNSFLSVTITKEFAELSNMVNWNLQEPIAYLGSGETESIMISGKYINFDEEGNLWLEIVGGEEVKPYHPDATFAVRLPKQAILSILTDLSPEARESLGFTSSK